MIRDLSCSLDLRGGDVKVRRIELSFGYYGTDRAGNFWEQLRLNSRTRRPSSLSPKRIVFNAVCYIYFIFRETHLADQSWSQEYPDFYIGINEAVWGISYSI